MKDTDIVTVCDRCLKACCWQGAFCCDEYKEAGTTEMTVADLKVLGYESPHYWDIGTGESEASSVRGENRMNATNLGACCVSGMSLREWYAGLAMQGLIAHDPHLNESTIGRLSVWFADALLNALETPSTPDVPATPLAPGDAAEPKTGR